MKSRPDVALLLIRTGQAYDNTRWHALLYTAKIFFAPHPSKTKKGQGMTRHAITKNLWNICTFGSHRRQARVRSDMDTAQLLLKHGVTGAVVGMAYGCVKVVLQPARPSNAFVAQYPNLSTDPQLTSVLQRFKRLEDTDPSVYNDVLLQGESLILLARNAGSNARGDQIMANRHSAQIVKGCKQLCHIGSTCKSEDTQRDAVALTMEMEHLSQLCNNHVHNMMV